MDGIRAEPLHHGLMDDALQAATVDRELRHVMAGIQPALFVPDLLAVTGQIKQLIGADSDLVEPIQQADGGELADRMRQRVDADAELADGIRLLEELAVDAARPQHERGGEAADTAADDNRLHGPNSTQHKKGRRLASHGPLFGRKRLCGRRLELGPRLRLSLNFEVLEILAIAQAVAEYLLLPWKVLRRAEDIGCAVPGGGLHRECRIDQMRPGERYEIGTAGSEDSVDLVGRRNVADAHGSDPRLVADLI